jgi:hypothetical protein
MLAQVPMDAKLAESLQQVAAERGKPLEVVMNDLARQYLREARREVIRQEVQHYQALYADLKAKYLGQHVAIHEGRLVDHDTDSMALAHRVRQRYGYSPILITQVKEQPMHEYRIRSPQVIGP